MTLKELREESGKSVKETAQALSVVIRAVYNYESGYRQMNLMQVLTLSEFFKVSCEDIIRAQLNSLSDRSNNRP